MSTRDQQWNKSKQTTMVVMTTIKGPTHLMFEELFLACNFPLGVGLQLIIEDSFAGFCL